MSNILEKLEKISLASMGILVSSLGLIVTFSQGNLLLLIIILVTFGASMILLQPSLPERFSVWLEPHYKI